MSLPVFQTFPLTTAAGAEIQGLDLSAPLSEDTTKRLRSIWLQHGVLFFRNQNLDPGQLLKVAKTFGETMPYPLLKGLVFSFFSSTFLEIVEKFLRFRYDSVSIKI